MPLKLRHAGRSDRGLVRKNNEDCVLLAPESALFGVCDGMGGHSAGEVASRTAVGTMTATFTLDIPELRQDAALRIDDELPQFADLLVKSIRLANRRIYNRALVDSELSGMGTTVAAVTFDANIVAIAHVGDSRVYLFRGDKLRPLTVDHSWVAEAQASGHLGRDHSLAVAHKNVITRALGVKESVEVDIALERVAPGDMFLLCSDGLCGFVDDDDIESVVCDNRRDIRKVVECLIRLANERGGSDNVSIVCVEALEIGAPLSYSSRQVVTVPQESLAVLEREDEWLEILAEKAKTEPPPEAPARNESARSSSSWVIGGILLALAALALWAYWNGWRITP